MPLSEHEQRLLEQIERALVDDDPKFASTVRTGDRRLKARHRLQFGAVAVVAGLGVLIGAAVIGAEPGSVVMGVFGFLIMLGGAALGILNYKTATGAVQAGTGSGKGGSGKGHGKGGSHRQPLKNRLEERFRRRYDQ